MAVKAKIQGNVTDIKALPTKGVVRVSIEFVDAYKDLVWHEFGPPGEGAIAYLVKVEDDYEKAERQE